MCRYAGLIIIAVHFVINPVIAGDIKRAVSKTYCNISSALLKAIKYGWFGTEPYKGLITPFERPPVKDVIEHAIYKEGLFGQPYSYSMDLEVVYEQPEEFDVELGEIYR